MWHPTIDDLTAAALPAEPADLEVSVHLHRCAPCRANVDALHRTIDVVRNPIDPHSTRPSEHVWDRLVAELAFPFPSGPDPEPLGPE